MSKNDFQPLVRASAFVIEELESRILLSATPAPTGPVVDTAAMSTPAIVVTMAQKEVQAAAPAAASGADLWDFSAHSSEAPTAQAQQDLSKISYETAASAETAAPVAAPTAAADVVAAETPVTPTATPDASVAPTTPAGQADSTTVAAQVYNQSTTLNGNEHHFTTVLVAGDLVVNGSGHTSFFSGGLIQGANVTYNDSLVIQAGATERFEATGGAITFQSPGSLDGILATAGGGNENVELTATGTITIAGAVGSGG
ncbi:MAG: LEPR-XLL domain-containing protein, partial [Verrucomicrobia bacterium]|nr:LEPR-XLL domain-containing protein [Verrucomicrobiota bacterium]